MTDGELRDLCNRFFDAIETGDVDAVAEIYADDFRMWVNSSASEMTKEDNLRVLRQGKGVHRRRNYDDRRIQTFKGGFLVQYSVNIVQHSGKRSSLSSCLLAQCKDGQITHIDEYLDSSRFTDTSKKALAK